MKILLVHNFYGSDAPSGENVAYRAEADLLRNNGHEIVEFLRTSDEIRSQGMFGTVRGGCSTVWNPFSLRKMRDTLQRVKPDIVHVHNTFPLHSPSIFYATRKTALPIVLTLHNYRLACAAGTAVRRNRLCFECLEKKSVLPSLKYGCYRNSRFATAPIAAMIALHTYYQTWMKNVDAMIALTQYQKQVLTAYGVPESVMHVKPHFGSEHRIPVPWEQRERKVVYIGRLYEAKGIQILLQAWKEWGSDAPALEVIGDGPLLKSLQDEIGRSPAAKTITFLGQLPHASVMDRLSSAQLLAIPSLCPEGFPMVLHEAFALGVPIAASNIGSLTSLVDEDVTGTFFEPGNPSDIVAKIRLLLAQEGKLRRMSLSAREEFEKKYTAHTNHDLLMNIYDSARRHRLQKSFV